MFAKRLTLAVTALALLWTAAPTAAQCAPAMGTGCPEAMAGMCRTQPVAGTQFEFMCPTCMMAGQNSIVLIGVPMSPVTIMMPITCGACTLGTQPLVAMNMHMLRLQIPDDPGLVGSAFSIQCVCKNMMMGCLELGARMDVTVMP